MPVTQLRGLFCNMLGVGGSWCVESRWEIIHIIQGVW